MDALLEAFGVDWKLLIAQAVNFGIVLLALTYLLYKPVMKTLDERAHKIAKGVEDATRAEEKLAHADEAAAHTVRTAEQEAEAVVARARDEASSERTRIVKEAEIRAATVLSDAELRAKENAASALRESEKEIARLAVLAAEKVLKEKI